MNTAYLLLLLCACSVKRARYFSEGAGKDDSESDDLPRPVYLQMGKVRGRVLLILRQYKKAGRLRAENTGLTPQTLRGYFFEKFVFFCESNLTTPDFPPIRKFLEKILSKRKNRKYIVLIIVVAIHRLSMSYDQRLPSTCILFTVPYP